MAALTFLAMGLWQTVCGGSQSTESLKWLQFMQTTATFLLPPILCAWLWDSGHKPFTWLKMDKKVSWQDAVLAVGIMICAIPCINLLADLNSHVQLPDSLVNIALMAFLPALSEELSFRGTLQQILGNKHAAIWITAFLFSAIHMQFYGFVPRMLMGATFGYIFLWTGSLWVPVLMHFTNNGLAVIVYYLFGQNNSADTIGTGTTWWLGVISLMITSLGLLIFYRRTHKG